MSPTFADLGVRTDLLALLDARGITIPTPLQEATIVDSLAGHDVCGKAPTGSGKTLAFGIPMVMRTERARPRQPRALVLVPTRELAAQVTDELKPLVQQSGRRIVALYGGVSYESQMKIIRRGVDIIVATPGRLEDMIERRAFSLSDVDIVVIDEADRMADMGFLPPVKRILDQTNSTRQTLLFSATLDGEVDALIKHYQNDPRRHAAVSAEDDAEVDHYFWTAPKEQRIRLIGSLVKRHERAIVFCRTRHGAERLAKQLEQVGVGAAAIHGDRTQAQREKALSAFKAGRVQALVATDVAARGIHVDAVPCVIHFDPAADHKDYLHRSGRTGRAGLSGVVVSLVTNEVRNQVKVLQRALGLPGRLDEPDVDAFVPAPRPAAANARQVAPTDTPAARTTRAPRSDRPGSTRSAAAASPPKPYAKPTPKTYEKPAKPYVKSAPKPYAKSSPKPRPERERSETARPAHHGSAHPVPGKPAKKARWSNERKKQAKVARERGATAGSVRRGGPARPGARGATKPAQDRTDRRR
ncbi:MAG TPA: DEAD/DEAH box helicase [Acidimicrobiales bacterium]|nr:DEAD/DEAH box helicase [Acidimicrobiales bacterium]